MGSPLMANAFMCSIEERLQDQGKMPDFYKRYVEDTLSIIPKVETAEAFLSTLNGSHPSISFTMELATNGKLPFWGWKSRNTCPAWRQRCIKSQQILDSIACCTPNPLIGLGPRYVKIPKSLKAKTFGAKKFPQKDNHTIYGLGNPISLSVNNEPAAIFTLRQKKFGIRMTKIYPITSLRA